MKAIVSPYLLLLLVYCNPFLWIPAVDFGTLSFFLVGEALRRPVAIMAINIGGIWRVNGKGIPVEVTGGYGFFIVALGANHAAPFGDRRNHLSKLIFRSGKPRMHMDMFTSRLSKFFYDAV